jgi:hypothetical protein
MLLIYSLFIPEACRSLVSHVAVLTKRWSKSLIANLSREMNPFGMIEAVVAERSVKERSGLPATIPIMSEKESCLLLFYCDITYAGYNIILVSLSQQLTSAYYYNSIHVALCYLPIGLVQIIGRIMDTNFHQHASNMGVGVI